MKNAFLTSIVFLLISCSTVQPLHVYVRDSSGQWHYAGDATTQEIRRVYNFKENVFRDLGSAEWQPITMDTVIIAKRL